jgi:hypothetical protein
MKDLTYDITLLTKVRLQDDRVVSVIGFDSEPYSIEVLHTPSDGKHKKFFIKKSDIAEVL